MSPLHPRFAALGRDAYGVPPCLAQPQLHIQSDCSETKCSELCPANTTSEYNPSGVWHPNIYTAWIFKHPQSKKWQTHGKPLSSGVSMGPYKFIRGYKIGTSFPTSKGQRKLKEFHGTVNLGFGTHHLSFEVRPCWVRRSWPNLKDLPRNLELGFLILLVASRNQTHTHSIWTILKSFSYFRFRATKIGTKKSIFHQRWGSLWDTCCEAFAALWINPAKDGNSSRTMWWMHVHTIPGLRQQIFIGREWTLEIVTLYSRSQKNCPSQKPYIYI